MDYIENCLSFSTTFLKENGLLKDGKSFYNHKCTWKRGEEIEACIGFSLIHVNEDQKQLILKYSIDDQLIEYSVDLVSIPSNLGMGKRWYFICPSTGQRCMKLIKPNNSVYFFHRTAFTIHYRVQTWTGVFRDLAKVFSYVDKKDELLERLNRRYAKTYYRGRGTLLMKRYLKVGEFLIELTFPAKII